MDLLDIPIHKLMSTNITKLESTDTLGYAILKMIQTRFSRLPVLKDDNLVGIFTTTDIIEVINESNSIEILEHNLSKHMVSDIISVDENERFKDALGIMAKQNVSCLPIVSGGNKLEGLFTNKDFLLFNIFWSEAEDYVIDETNPYLKQLSDQYILPQHSTISQIIDVMHTHDLNYILIEDQDNDLISSISKDRIIRSIASSLIIEGLDINYLNQKVVEMVVSDPVFKMKIGQSVDSYRKFMNRRGIDSLFLTKEEEITHILNEESIRDTAFEQLIK